MLILDTAGDTIQAEGSAASSITITCYGIETASNTDTYKKLGQSQLTGSGTQDTIYTVPASTSTVCSVIVIANTSTSARTVKLWHVPNGGSVNDNNAILGTVNLEAHTSLVWNKGNIQTVPNVSIGGMLKSTYDADDDGLIDQSAGGTELDTSGVTNGQLLIGNSTGNVWALATLTGTANQVTVTSGASSITLSTNVTAANLLTACATNAGALDFSAASKTLTVEDNAVVSQDYSSDASPQFTGIELGHASDTTITRVSAGIIAVEGTNVMLVGDAPTAHTIASHSDTTGTGAELDTLTGGGDVGALHTHAAAYQPLDAELTSLAGLTYAAASFVKMTGAATFALRTVGETADDLEATIDHDNLANGGAHDYSYISGNDGDTGITGAELEELSDGSTTTLHSHGALKRSIILSPQCNCGPASDFATQDTIAGGSTPNEAISVLDFDASASEYADFKFILPAGYNSGGLTVTIIFSMTSDHDESTPHKVRWEVAFRRIQDDAEDINSSHSYSYNGVSAIVPSEVGEISYDDITFTDGADMDSLAAGEMAILRIYRDHDHADDNATGDAELQMIQIRET